MRKPRLTSVIAPVLAASLAVSAAAVAGTWSVRGVDKGTAARTLTITGHVNGMHPGMTKTLRLRIHNPFAVHVAVYVIRVHVRRGHGPNGRCAGRFLVTHPWKGVRRIPAERTRVVRVKVRLRRRAPDRCQGAQWPLTFDARSTRV